MNTTPDPVDPAADPELMTIKDVCTFFTGEHDPVDTSTVYRWIRKGKIPGPIRISPAIQRWKRSELQKIKDEMFAQAGR
jgi:predicted DNA-binding transcriptional regulator AlpA